MSACSFPPRLQVLVSPALPHEQPQEPLQGAPRLEIHGAAQNAFPKAVPQRHDAASLALHGSADHGRLKFQPSVHAMSLNDRLARIVQTAFGVASHGSTP